MTTLYKYRIYCSTDSQYEYQWAETEPSTCPTNTAHTIDATKTSIVDKVDPNETLIKEESTPTGGNFDCTTLKVNATKNTISTSKISWPYPISALSVDFISTSTHSGDFISLAVGKDTITGAITANISPASAWVSQNYTVGQMVTYVHPNTHYGTRTYACTTNTVSNEVPTDTTYWKHGLELSVEQTVIDNTARGYHIKLDDGTNTDEVERVISIDDTNNKIYVETNPANSYLAATPTYIKQTAYSIKDYELREAWDHTIGESKIGGSYVPADVIVELIYDNKSTDTDKVLIGRVEYLH